MKSSKWLMLIVAVAVLGLSSCHRGVVQLEGRPCGADNGSCVSGYTCNPLTGECVRPVDLSCPAGDACPSPIAGGACDVPGGFVPCHPDDADCHNGCHTCQADLVWSACESPDCTLGTPTACDTCDNDCSAVEANATATCQVESASSVCGHGACAEGYADQDGDADPNAKLGCECRRACSNKCGEQSSDECGGTCADFTCALPLTCGGGGVAGACGCTPQCNNRCAGDDGCGGTCSTSCGVGGTCDAVTHTCTCVARSDAKICEAALAECGTVMGSDGCGATRQVSCGNCSNAEVCSEPTSTNPNTCLGQPPPCGYSYRVQATISSPVALPTGYAVSLTFSHKALVDATRSRADGDDIRVMYVDAASALHELDRVVDPTSDWNQQTTQLWFKLWRSVAAGAPGDGSYYLYFGSPNAGNPPRDEGNVFLFADFFDGTNTASTSPWTITHRQDVADDVYIDTASGGLFFNDAGGASKRPIVQHSFASTSGLLQWRYGFNWAAGSDDAYYVYAQLGVRTAMEEPNAAETDPMKADAAQGVGPDLVWGSFVLGGQTKKNRLGCWLPAYGPAPADIYASANTSVATDDAHLNGRDIQVDVDSNHQTYTVAVDGVRYNLGRTLRFYANTSVSALDTVRFMTTDVGTSGGTVGDVAHRRFEYVLIRSVVANEPVPTVNLQTLPTIESVSANCH